MKKTYNSKLMIYLMTIAIIPLLTISSSVFLGTKQMMMAQIYGFSDTYLKQVINATDIVLKQVSDSCKQMAIDDVFAEFETFYKGSYYEKLIEKMTFIDDLEGTRIYMESKSKLFKRMNALKLSNEFVESVYLLDTRKKTVYTDVGLQYPVEDFYDQEWLAYSTAEFISPEFIDTRWAKQSDGTQKQVITLLIRSYYSVENVIAVNLNARELHRRVKSINNEEGNILVALSSDDEVIWSDIQSLGLDVQAEAKQNTEVKQTIYTLDGERYSFNKQESGYTGWQFIQGINLEKYFTKLSRLAGLILIITSICFLGVIGGAFVLSQRLYQPIQKLFKNLGIYKKQSVASKDEFDTIGDMVSDMGGEREVLEKKLSYSLPAYREKFLQGILLYEMTSKESVKQQLELLEIPLKEGEWGIVILAMQMSEQLLNMETIEKYKNRIDETIQKVMKGLIYELLELENDKVVFIFNKPEKSEKELCERLEKLSKVFKQQENCRPIIAISRWTSDWSEIKEVFSEVDQFFKYLLVNNKIGVNGILEEQLGRDKPLIYPKDRLDLLSGYLRNGDLEATKQVFNQILNQWSQEEKLISLEQAQLIYFEVLSCVLHTLTLIGLDISKVYGTGRNLYQELIEQQTLQTITQWFEVIFEMATVQINQGVVEHKNKYVSQMIEFLENDCSQMISLEGISEQLGVNPNYLSRVFKEVTGKKFIDYLTGIRIEKSIQLLIKGELKIKEIAEAVGYPNANYYIKIFKEYQGITPGEYKKLYSNKKIE